MSNIHTTCKAKPLTSPSSALSACYNTFVLYVEGHLTTKSDVYSFGVVLVELLSGRRAIDKNRPQGEHNLVEWAKPYLSNKRKVFNIMDNRLNGQYPQIEAQKVALLALQCLSNSSKFRPNMNQVVTSLDQLQNLTKKQQPVQKRSRQSLRRAKQRSLEESANDVSYPKPSVSPLKV